MLYYRRVNSSSKLYLSARIWFNSQYSIGVTVTATDDLGNDYGTIIHCGDSPNGGTYTGTCVLK